MCCFQHLKSKKTKERVLSISYFSQAKLYMHICTGFWRVTDLFFVSCVNLLARNAVCDYVHCAVPWSLIIWFSAQGQGMISFIHLAKNVIAAEIGGYTDVVLDACCQNVACDDEIWHYLVEMSVLLVTSTQRNNPRSLWYWFF